MNQAKYRRDLHVSLKDKATDRRTFEEKESKQKERTIEDLGLVYLQAEIERKPTGLIVNEIAFLFLRFIKARK